MVQILLAQGTLQLQIGSLISSPVFRKNRIRVHFLRVPTLVKSESNAKTET